MVYAQLGIYGYFLYGFGPTVHLLRDELGISRTLAGLHGTALAAGAIVAGVTGPAAVRRFGRGPLLWFGVAGLCVGVAGYCGFRVLPMTLLAALVCGTCGAWIVNATNAGLMEAHGESGAAALSEANAVAATAGTIAPLVVGGAVGVGLGWRAGLLVTLVLSAVAWLVFRGVRLPEPRAIDPADHPGGAHSLPRGYWFTWGVLVCTIGIEFCLSLWAGDLLTSRDGLSAGAATATWSGLLLGFALSRLVGARLAVRYSVDTVLLAALLTLLGGFALFWLTTVGWLAVVGLFVAGLGLGVQYPLTIGRAITAAAGRSDLASARASLGAGLAVGVGPFLLGTLADRYGSHTAFLLVPGLIALAALGLVVSRSSAPQGRVV